MRKIAIASVSVMFVITSLFGCASSPPEKEAKKLDLALAASLDVNKDGQGRSAPILVKVYELRSLEAFETADFLDLQGGDRKILQQDLLNKDEFILQPGASERVKRIANPETQVIGLVAEYRDLSRSTWRVAYKLQPSPDEAWYRVFLPRKKVKLKIQYESNSIKITEISVSK